MCKTRILRKRNIFREPFNSTAMNNLCINVLSALLMLAAFSISQPLRALLLHSTIILSIQYILHYFEIFTLDSYLTSED